MDKKLERYTYSVYILEELLRVEIADITEDWYSDCLKWYEKGKLNAYKEALYFLTDDEKWALSLEDLAKLLND